jgi:hypothetical protein
MPALPLRPAHNLRKMAPTFGRQRSPNDSPNGSPRRVPPIHRHKRVRQPQGREQHPQASRAESEDAVFERFIDIQACQVPAPAGQFDPSNRYPSWPAAGVTQPVETKRLPHRIWKGLKTRLAHVRATTVNPKQLQLRKDENHPSTFPYSTTNQAFATWADQFMSTVSWKNQRQVGVLTGSWNQLRLQYWWDLKFDGAAANRIPERRSLALKLQVTIAAVNCFSTISPAAKRVGLEEKLAALGIPFLSCEDIYGLTGPATKYKRGNTAFKPFRFLALPPEIRNKIYWFCLCARSRVIIRDILLDSPQIARLSTKPSMAVFTPPTKYTYLMPRPDPHYTYDVVPTSNAVGSPPITEMLLVNRQICREASAILYGQHFEFRQCSGDLALFTASVRNSALCQRINGCRQLVRTIRFKIPSWRTINQLRCTLPTFLGNYLPELHAWFPALQTVALVLPRKTQLSAVLLKPRMTKRGENEYPWTALMRQLPEAVMEEKGYEECLKNAMARCFVGLFKPPVPASLLERLVFPESPVVRLEIEDNDVSPGVVNRAWELFKRDTMREVRLGGNAVLN